MYINQTQSIQLDFLFVGCANNFTCESCLRKARELNLWLGFEVEFRAIYDFVMDGGREAQLHINTFQNGFKDIAKFWNI